MNEDDKKLATIKATLFVLLGVAFGAMVGIVGFPYIIWGMVGE